MERLKEEAIKLNSDDDFIRLMTDEEEDRLLKNSYIKEARDNGIEEGIKQGTEQTTIELTKKMLKNNIDVKTISEITGLPINEINKIRDEL